MKVDREKKIKDQFLLSDKRKKKWRKERDKGRKMRKANLKR